VNAAVGGECIEALLKTGGTSSEQERLRAKAGARLIAQAVADLRRVVRGG